MYLKRTTGLKVSKTMKHFLFEQTLVVKTMRNTCSGIQNKKGFQNKMCQILKL